MTWQQALEWLLELDKQRVAIADLYFSTDTVELEALKYLREENTIVRNELRVIAQQYPEIVEFGFYTEFVSCVDMLEGFIYDFICRVEEM